MDAERGRVVRVDGGRPHQAAVVGAGDRAMARGGEVEGQGSRFDHAGEQRRRRRLAADLATEFDLPQLLLAELDRDRRRETLLDLLRHEPGEKTLLLGVPGGAVELARRAVALHLDDARLGDAGDAAEGQYDKQRARPVSHLSFPPHSAK